VDDLRRRLADDLWAASVSLTKELFDVMFLTGV